MHFCIYKITLVNFRLISNQLITRKIVRKRFFFFFFLLFAHVFSLSYYIILLFLQNILKLSVYLNLIHFWMHTRVFYNPVLTVYTTKGLIISVVDPNLVVISTRHYMCCPIHQPDIITLFTFCFTTRAKL